MTTLTQALIEPTEGLQMNNNREIFITIDSDFVVPCLEFMVAKQIPFEIYFNSKNDSSRVQKIPVIEKQDSYLLKSLPVASDSEIVKKIYDKYMNTFPTTYFPKIEIMSDEFDISPFKLKRLFLQHFGQTIYQVFMKVRMEKSAELLKKGYKARDVARFVGYGNNSDIKFNKMFQKYYGSTPKKYQNQFKSTLRK